MINGLIGFAVGFVLGLIVAKNLLRWLTVTFRSDPVGALQKQINDAKAHLEAVKARLWR